MSPSRRVVDICYWWFITLSPLWVSIQGALPSHNPGVGMWPRLYQWNSPQKLSLEWRDPKRGFWNWFILAALAWHSNDWSLLQFPRAVTVPAIMKQDSVAFSSVLWVVSCPPARCFSVYASSGCFLWPTTKNILTTSSVSQAEAEFDLGETQHQNFLQRSRGNWLTD